MGGMWRLVIRMHPINLLCNVRRTYDGDWLQWRELSVITRTDGQPADADGRVSTALTTCDTTTSRSETVLAAIRRRETREYFMWMPVSTKFIAIVRTELVTADTQLSR